MGFSLVFHGASLDACPFSWARFRAARSALMSRWMEAGDRGLLVTLLLSWWIGGDAVSPVRQAASIAAVRSRSSHGASFEDEYTQRLVGQVEVD
jgi:hypothetical protein